MSVAPSPRPAAGGGPEASALAGVGLSLDHSADALQELGPALDMFEKLDLDSVEIFLPALGVVMGGRIRRGPLMQMRRVCADRPFSLTVHGALSCNLGDRPNAQLHRDIVRATIEVAAEIGAPLMVQHAAHVLDPTPARVADALACEREGLAELAATAQAAKVVVAVETVNPDATAWAASPRELAAQLDAAASPWIAATLDFSHAALNAARRGFDMVAEMRDLARHARHLHLHDSFGRVPAFRPWSHGDAMMFGFGDLHLPPGAGALPWDALAGLPYAGPAIANLELNKRWQPEWPEALAWARRWVAQARDAQAARAR
ncbi:MAG: TIM barrel protein [Rubrimonas sp.]|uniref:TIM barrel protein n=1 Tax=Rubrimonas sp. TaxID=2036015 RepID=UPI002FDDCE77